MGNLLAVHVHAANIHDTKGGVYTFEKASLSLSDNQRSVQIKGIEEHLRTYYRKKAALLTYYATLPFILYQIMFNIFFIHAFSEKLYLKIRTSFHINTSSNNLLKLNYQHSSHRKFFNCSKNKILNQYKIFFVINTILINIRSRLSQCTVKTT